MPETNESPTPEPIVTTPVVNVLKSKDKDGNEVELLFNADRFLTNAYPDNMLDSDARKLVSTALQTTIGRGNYAYVVGITKDKVIYETYDYDDYTGYFTYQRSYEISADKTVTLKDDTERVVLTMEVTPFKADVTTPVKANSGDPQMPDNAPAPVAPETTTTETTPTATTPAVTTEAAAPAPATVAVQAAPAPRTLNQFIAEAPPEYREVIEAGLKVHNEQKQSIIKALKSTNRCKFSDDQLNGMSLAVLQDLAELATIPRFNGSNPGPSEVELHDNAEVPPMPRLIPEKAATA